MDGVHLKAGLRLAMELSARGNQYLQESKLDNTLFAESRVQFSDAIINILTGFVSSPFRLHGFHPYICTTSQERYILQLNATERLISDTFELVLLPGHVIGKPDYLFTRIDEKKEAEWRKKFGGQQKKPKVAKK